MVPKDFKDTKNHYPILIESYKVKNLNAVITILCFIILPGLSFPLLLMQIYYNHKYAYICLAILLGLWSFLMAPIGDMYRYSMDYYLYKDYDYNQFSQLILLKNDYLLGIVLYTLSKLNLPPDISRFLYVSIGSMIIFLLFQKIVPQLQEKYGKKTVFLLFLILFLNFKYSSFSFRFNFSCALYVLGGFLLINNKKKALACILLLISVINHISFVLFLFPILLSYIFPKFCGKRLSLILIILIFTFTGTFVNDLLKILAPHNALVQHALYYTDGVWAGAFLEGHSLFYKIKLIIDSIPIYTLLIVYYFIFRKNRWACWIDYLLVIVVITAPYVSLKGRCLSASFFPILFYIIYSFPTIKELYRIRILKTLIITGIILSFSSLWGSRRELNISQEQKLFTTNIINILSHSYDYNWLRENVNEDGSPAKINY